MPFFEHGLDARMQCVEIVLAAALSPIDGVTSAQQAKDLPASHNHDISLEPSSILPTRFAIVIQCGPGRSLDGKLATKEDDFYGIQRGLFFTWIPLSVHHGVMRGSTVDTLSRSDSSSSLAAYSPESMPFGVDEVQDQRLLIH